MAIGVPTDAGGKTFFGQPGGLSTLFFTEMWERFSYYGMRAILVLYLTAPLTGENPGLAIDSGTATAIYGTYVGLVYLTPIAGGWIADRVLGGRRTVLYGAIVIAAGHYLMAVPFELSFWLGLLAIALGTGLLKPNISGLVGQLYSEGDTRRDAGFSIFYMGINIGALVAPLITGKLAEEDWHWGFAAAGVGMTLGLIQYVLGRKRLNGVGEDPVNPADDPAKRQAVMIGAAVLAFLAVVSIALSLLRGGFGVTSVTDAVTLLILIVPIVYFRGLFARDLSREQHDHVKAFVWVFFGAAFFWMIFEQAGSTLTLFANDVTQLTVGGDAWRVLPINQPTAITESSLAGWEIPAAWMQSINPLFIIIFAPIFAGVWTKLADRAPRTPVKFGIALIGVGLSFAMLIIPMSHFMDTGQKVTVWWLMAVYLLQTWAELLLSPNGLSASTKLAPPGTLGQILALWFLATSVGTTVGGQIARLTAGEPTLAFAVCGGMAVAFGVLMLVMARRISALMGHVH